jgi:hypothetical protein
MATLDEWTQRACAALALPADALDQRLVLDLARDVAHRVARPAAPLTAYLAGVAVGRGATPAEVFATLNELLPPPTDE